MAENEEVVWVIWWNYSEMRRGGDQRPLLHRQKIACRDPGSHSMPCSKVRELFYCAPLLVLARPP